MLVDAMMSSIRHTAHVSSSMPSHCAVFPAHIPARAPVSLRQFRHCAITSPCLQTRSRKALAVCAGYQQPLPGVERKAKRAESQRLGDKLVVVHMGKNGISPSFLQSVIDVFNAHELVKASHPSQCRNGRTRVEQARPLLSPATKSSFFSAASALLQVRAGGGSDMDMKELGAELSAALDCVVVHKIGFTLTLFRDKSLPRLPRAVELEAEGGPRDAEDDCSDDESSSDEEIGPPRPPPPPEFTIIQ